MNATERYEVMAEAFYRMTGYMAPGKSQPMEMANTREERQAAWEVWHAAYGGVVHAMLSAFEVILKPYDSAPNEGQEQITNE